MTLFRRRVRLIPPLLVVAVSLLAIKVSDVVLALSGLGEAGTAISVARAEGASGHGKPSGEGAEHASAKPGEGEHGGAPKCDAAAPVPAGEAVIPAPPGPTPEELALLQELGQRRRQIDDRAAEIDRRADVLRAGEARLDQKLVEMHDLQKLLDGLIKKHDEQQEAQMMSLVRIYENMKPKDAARIFEELDMDTLLPVAERMNERKLAPVMAQMNPAKAKTITEELAKIRQLVSSKKNADRAG